MWLTILQLIWSQTRHAVRFQINRKTANTIRFPSIEREAKLHFKVHKTCIIITINQKTKARSTYQLSWPFDIYSEKKNPFKLNILWSCWQFSIRFRPKWNSIWLKIERKTVTTRSYSIQFERKSIILSNK